MLYTTIKIDCYQLPSMDDKMLCWNGNLLWYYSKNINTLL